MSIKYVYFKASDENLILQGVINQYFDKYINLTNNKTNFKSQIIRILNDVRKKYISGQIGLFYYNTT